MGEQTNARGRHRKRLPKRPQTLRPGWHSRQKTALVGVLVLVAIGLVVAPASTALAGTVRVGRAPQVDAAFASLGALAPATTLHAEVALTPRDPAALQAFVTAVSTPGSPQYRQYLTTAQFASRFGAPSGTGASVATALQAVGLSTGTPDPDGLFVPVSGSVATFERALSVSFHRYRGPKGRTLFANTAAPAIPRAIASLVRGIVGLDNLTVPVSSAALASDQPQTGGPTLNPSCATVSSSARTAPRLAEAYGLNPIYNGGDLGSGSTVAIYELEPYAHSSTDTSTFDTCYGISDNTTYEQVDGGPIADGSSDDGLETQLDIDTVSELAPSANIVVYQGPNNLTDATADGPFDTYKQIVDDNSAKVISTSWGECELDMGYSGSVGAQAESTLFAQAASQGQTILAASGDQGSEGCDYQGTNRTQLAVQDPASQPDVTGVGGTTLTSYTTTPPTESAWRDGGGGISSFWTMPTYQSSAPAGLNVVNSHSSGSPCSASSGDCREVPDVSADADTATPYIVYWGSWTGVGGTSGAAPLWAAIIALADADNTCAVSPVGLANPALYAIAATSSYSSAFNDVTSGNNDAFSAHSGLYPATSKYDMVTGLGTPDAAGLLPLLGSPCVSSVSPAAASAGTTVTVSGEHLAGATSVSFGGVAATAQSIVASADGTSLTVTVPVGSGVSPTVDVDVTTPRGASPIVSADHFTNVATVSGLSPAAGTTGSSIQISGSAFTGVTSVTFGGVTATSFSVNSDSSITAVAPSNPDGTVPIVVTSSNGSSAATTADLFTYGVPVVTSLSGSTGSPGTAVTITGARLQNATSVAFGGATASFTVLGDTSISTTVPAAAAGPVEVTVTNADGPSTTGAGSAYTTPAKVSGLSVGAGTASTPVTITGSGFSALTGVTFGGVSAPVQSSSPTSVSVLAPSGPTGTVAVVVTNAAGGSALSNADRFTYGVPIVTSSSPSSGGGGSTVNLVGSGFANATAVQFGTTNATSFTVSSDTSISAVVPSDTGSVRITVVNAAGQSSTSSAFTYAAPAITSLSPSAGPAGTTITINGTALASVSQVAFGGVAVAAFTPVNDNTITVTAPSGFAGVVNISLTNPVGNSPTTTSDQFTYPPAVSSLSAQSGPVSGGTTVIITGSGFSSVPATGAVTFGGSPASYTVLSDTTISAIAPSSGAGTVTVVVSGIGGSSTGSSSSNFTFEAPPATTTTVASVPVTTITIAPVHLGPPSAKKSELAVDTPTVAATGNVHATVTATIKDSAGHLLPGQKVTLAALSGKSTVSPSVATTNRSGNATFAVSDKHAETVSFKATDTKRGVVLADRVTVTFGVLPSATRSTLVLTQAVRTSCPGGSGKATAVVTLRSATGAVLGGRLISLSASTAKAVVRPTSAVTSPAGTATFALSDATRQTVTFVASDRADGVAVTGKLVLSFPAPKRC